LSTKPRVARKMIAEGAATVVLREMKIEGLRVDPIRKMCASVKRIQVTDA
jgi:hypothetical protein